MVECVPDWGEAGCELSETDRPVKATTRKRKLEVSPDIRRRLRKFEKENPTDSPVKSFLKQFQYESETEDNEMTRSRQSLLPPQEKKKKKRKKIKNNLRMGRIRKALRKESVKTKTSS